MQEELLSLIKLQEMDAAIDDLHAQAESIDPLIKSKTQSIEDLKTGLKTTKEKLSSHQLKKKQLELDADSQEKLVQKHQSELNSLKSNDAYKAMLGEIQAAKNAVVKIEDDILSLMEKIEADEKIYKEFDKKFKTDEAGVKAEVQSLESKKSDLLAQAGKKKEDRDAFAKTVSAKHLAQYEAVREQRGGMAIAPLLNKKSCGGCRMGLTHAKINEIVKGKDLIICDTCMRILYNPPDKKEESASSGNPSAPPPPQNPQATPVS